MNPSAHRSGLPYAPYARTGATNRYLTELDKLPRLSLGEEQQLMEQYQRGCIAARNRIIQTHLRFVVRIAKQYYYPGIVLNDLISEGNLGMFRALERFDPGQDVKFLSYAIHFIRQRIERYIARHTDSGPAYEDYVVSWKQYHIARKALLKEYEREPTLVELAETLGVRPFYVNRLLERHCSVIYLNEDSEQEFLLVVEKESDTELSDRIQEWLSHLDEREYYVISRYFGLDGAAPQHFGQIGEALGGTGAMAQQIKEQVFNRVRMSQRSSRQ